MRRSILPRRDLVIATVNYGHIVEMQKLGCYFEQANPDIKLKWVTLEEGVLRQRTTTADAVPRRQRRHPMMPRYARYRALYSSLKGFYNEPD